MNEIGAVIVQVLALRMSLTWWQRSSYLVQWRHLVQSAVIHGICKTRGTNGEYAAVIAASMNISEDMSLYHL